MKSLKFLLIIAVLTLFALPVAADTFIKQFFHQDGFQMQGQNMEARNDTTQTDSHAGAGRPDRGRLAVAIDPPVVYQPVRRVNPPPAME